MIPVLKRAWSIFQESLFPFLFLATLGNLFFLTASPPDLPAFARALFQLNFAFFLKILLHQTLALLVFFYFALAYLLLLLSPRKAPSRPLEDALYEALLLYPRFLLSLLLLFLLFVVGVFFVLGWIFVLLLFWLYIPSFCAHRGNVKAALKESLTLFLGHSFSLLGLALAFFLLSSLLQLFLFFLGSPWHTFAYLVESFFALPATASLFLSLKSEPAAPAIR